MVIISFVFKQKISDIGSELIIELCGEMDDTYVTMFEHLDTHSDELGITSYGVSVTSLEDVFIKLV